MSYYPGFRRSLARLLAQSACWTMLILRSRILQSLSYDYSRCGPYQAIWRDSFISVRKQNRLRAQLGIKTSQEHLRSILIIFLMGNATNSVILCNMTLKSRILVKTLSKRTLWRGSMLGCITWPRLRHELPSYCIHVLEANAEMTTGCSTYSLKYCNVKVSMIFTDFVRILTQCPSFFLALSYHHWTFTIETYLWTWPMLYSWTLT